MLMRNLVMSGENKNWVESTPLDINQQLLRRLRMGRLTEVSRISVVHNSLAIATMFKRMQIVPTRSFL